MIPSGTASYFVPHGVDGPLKIFLPPSLTSTFLGFVDFRKAFDSVQHEKLGFKMLEMGYLHMLWIYSLNFIVNSKQELK